MFYFPRIFSLILFSDDHFFNKFNNELHTDDRQREKESTAGGKGERGDGWRRWGEGGGDQKRGGRGVRWVEEMGRGRGGRVQMGGGDREGEGEGGIRSGGVGGVRWVEEMGRGDQKRGGGGVGGVRWVEGGGWGDQQRGEGGVWGGWDGQRGWGAGGCSMGVKRLPEVGDDGDDR